MSFDNLLALTPLPSRSSNASLVFARTAPPEMAFAGVGGAFVYGGYLTALVAKATLESVNPRGYPHILSLTVDVVSGVAGGEELEITVDLPRTTRRLAFARITICPARTPGRPSVLAQSLCGTLSPATPAPSIGQRVSSTLSFSRVRTHVPSLKAPSDGVQDLIALATGLPPPPDAVDKRAQFVTMIHSREALTFAKARIAVGAGELRREGWDGLDAMPFILSKCLHMVVCSSPG
ncbi:hypothetical protein M427DRAFT_193592 [Gonapodya prolifera JEL478]|uniref:Acyl-CoA thioesterase-like N-terminal HotDog domain-containing protein n=1 Tax=Gonapodya prolifera (strain JEL478) TaxID=1344416 RepID=A0A138ZZT9_GONPJ|nr:hypothetical protein M427DRAFT_193592 [Gonapodya prolifera JEL478]|eukprot:KXS10020.1 hypothetical protein M427DRAFT_193592 [Gonapodya prolifera JEL478]